MAALIALVASGVFASGAIAGIIGVVSVAIRREERNLTLISGAPDNVTRAGRLLNGVYVRAPHRTPAAGGTCLTRQRAQPVNQRNQVPGPASLAGLPRKPWRAGTPIKPAPAPAVSADRMRGARRRVTRHAT